MIRYLLCEVVYVDGRRLRRHLSRQDLFNTIKNAVIKYHGDYGIGVLMTSLSVRYANPETNIVLIRAARGAYQMVQSAMSLIKQIGIYEAFFRTLHVGGTIRTCQKFLINYNKEQFLGLSRQCKTEEEKQQIQQLYLGNTLLKERENLDNDSRGLED